MCIGLLGDAEAGLVDMCMGMYMRARLLGDEERAEEAGLGHAQQLELLGGAPVRGVMGCKGL